jgi:ornithine decarboxylase
MLIKSKINSDYLMEKLPHLLAASKHLMPSDNARIGYVNLFHKSWSGSTEGGETPNMIEEITKELQTHLVHGPENIISFGFIYSNTGCDTQNWHIDYGGNTDTFFIPMVDIDESNGTEFLDYAESESIKAEMLNISNKFFYNNDLRSYLSFVLGIKEYSFRVVKAPSMSLIKMSSHVLHRGRCNTSSKTRVMFQIVTSNVPNIDICSDYVVKDAELDEPSEMKKVLDSRTTSSISNQSIPVSHGSKNDSYYKYATIERGIDASAAVHETERAIAQDIASSSSLPFFVVNLSTVAQKLIKWKAFLPRIKPFYAIKSNDDIVLCRLLADGGCGFDCASQVELEQIIGLGVRPDQIIFANPCKQSSMIKYAHSVGVKLMTADHVDELVKIKDCSPDASVLIRIAVDDSKSACRFNTKFGAHESELDHLFTTAIRLGVCIAGFSYHIGSGCSDLQPFADAVSISKRAFEKANGYGLSPSILDIGGGFYGHDDDAFEIVARTISAAIDLHFPSDSNIEIIAEPGRYFGTASHTYATEVIAKKNSSIFINDGVYGCFNCVLLDKGSSVVPQALHCDAKGPMVSTKIFGPTCDSLDVVAENVQLPELAVGDWIYVRNMGSYTRCAASLFNGQGKYAVYYVWVE